MIIFWAFRLRQNLPFALFAHLYAIESEDRFTNQLFSREHTHVSEKRALKTDFSMKKHLLTLVAICCLSVLSQAQVIITEIMYNPPEGGNDSLEYIELHNPTNAAISLAGWTMSKGVTYTFPVGASIASKGYTVLCKSNSAFFGIFGVQAIQWDSTGALTNGGETVAISNAAGVIVDSVKYANAAPWPVGPNGNGSSLVLCDFTSDNNLPASWAPASTTTGKIINMREVLGNPFAASACSSGVDAVDDQATFAAGGTSTIAVITNDFIPGGTVSSVTIIRAPKSGVAVVEADNRIKYTPNATLCGRDSLMYRVCGAAGLCDSAMVRYNVLCFPARTIAQMTTESATGLADSIGKGCTIEGVVNITNLRATGLQFSMQDAGAGITVFRTQSNSGYTPKIGDRISVVGSITQFNGLTQITADTVIFKTANNTLTAVTAAKIDEATESEFVKLSPIYRFVDPAQWTTGVGTTGFTVLAVNITNPTDTLSIRVDNDITAWFNAPVPKSPFTISGVCTQFDANTPLDGGYQIFPRALGDFAVGYGDLALVSEIEVYPNPTSDLLTVTTEQVADQIIVTDMLGKQIVRINNLSEITNIGTSAWANGMYLVTIYKGDLSATIKVTVAH
jgi:Lamin Tail Domain/Secretion system C-terminal sorting domain/Bacterial Ig domain